MRLVRDLDRLEGRLWVQEVSLLRPDSLIQQVGAALDPDDYTAAEEARAREEVRARARWRP